MFKILLLYILIILQFHNHSTRKCLRSNETVSWQRHFYVANKTLPLIIDVSKSHSHRLISHILKILLTDRLSYADVVFAEIPDLKPTQLIERLYTGGSISSKQHRNKFNSLAHINMEIWQSPGFNVESWVNKGLILDCGPLGPITRRGIFSLAHPSNELFGSPLKSIDHWTTFKYPYNYFKYSKLYQFLSENNDWIPIRQYNMSQLMNSPIVLIEYKNSEKKLTRIFMKVYKSQDQIPVIMVSNSKTQSPQQHLQSTLDLWYTKLNSINSNSSNTMLPPLFFYQYYPSSVTVQHLYNRVLFPDCYGSLDNDDLCDFEVNQLSKMVWSQLKYHALLVYNLVTQFTISQSTIVQLLIKIGSDKTSDDDFFNIACDWVKDNKQVWSQWTEGWNIRQKLVISGLYALYGKWVPDNIVKASNSAIQSVNSNIFKNTSYEIVLDIRNLSCSDDNVLKEYLTLSTKYNQYNYAINLAYLAAVCSDSLESTLKVATFKRHILVTSTADSPKFDNSSQYKYFYRTIPSMQTQMSLLISTFREFDWKRIVIMRKDSMFFNSKFFQSQKIEVIEDFVEKESQLTFAKIYKFLKNVRDQKHGKIFLVEYFAEATRDIMCAAYKLSMTLDNGFVWLLNPWMSRHWNLIRTANCTVAEIINSTSKYMVLGRRELLSTPYNTFPNQNKVIYSSPRTPFAHFTKEAIDRIARATKLLLQSNPSALSILDSPDIAEKFVELISLESHSSGSTSRTNSNSPGGLIRGIWLLYAVTPTILFPIFTWNFDEKRNTYFNGTIDNVIIHSLSVEGKRNFWGPRNNFNPPPDGSIRTDNTSDCVLEKLRQLFGGNISCSGAIFFTCGMVMIFILVLIILIFVFGLRHIHKTQEKERARKPFELLCEELAYLDLPSQDVVINRVVGRGNFGTVYGGEAWQDNRWVLVAIKAITKDLDFQYKYDFLSEAKLMSTLNHDNIVKLIGICLHPANDKIYLVMEHVTGGDLKKFLVKRRIKAKEDPNNEKINPMRLTKFARDIASGLAYLHQNKLLHRDIACRNCLIDPEFGIKVGDFGLAKKMKCDRKRGSWYYRLSKSDWGEMPIRWLSPESLQFGNYSVHSDIWSYGVTLYEIVTFGNFPYVNYEHEAVVSYIKRAAFTIADFLPTSFRHEIVFSIIQKCCNYYSKDRYEKIQDIIDIFDKYPECVKPSLSDDPACPDLPFSQSLSASNNGSFDMAGGIDSVNRCHSGNHSDSRHSNRSSYTPGYCSDSVTTSANYCRAVLPRQRAPATITRQFVESSSPELPPPPPILHHHTIKQHRCEPTTSSRSNNKLIDTNTIEMDFLNSFVGLDDPVANPGLLTNNYKNTAKSSSTEFIHLPPVSTTGLPSNNPDNNVTRETALVTNDPDPGYVTYKNLNACDDDHPPQTSDFTSHQDISNRLNDERPLLSTPFLTKQSFSLDLSTDTACFSSDADTDKISPEFHCSSNDTRNAADADLVSPITECSTVLNID